jgi:protein phosphatase
MRPAPDLPAVDYAERSDPGRDPDKQVNEDACGHRGTRFGHLCIVCDGMGGHAAGREAAELALAAIFEAFDRAPDGTPPADVLRSAVEEASGRIHTMQTSEVAMGRPGSTVAAVLMHAQGTEVAHVGDSRAYLVHEGQIFRLTRDHSVVQELVDRGLLTPQQAAHHPEANRITRALGMAADVTCELRPQPVHHVSGDTFVLCSDGLCDLVEDHEILEIVGGEPPAQAVGKLVDLANARGGHDNVTVVILRAREGAAAATATITPTMAQTSVTQGTAPSAAAQVPVTRSVVPTPAPSVPWTRTGRRPGPAVILVLALAVGAAVLLVGVLLEEFAERGGKRNVRTGQEGLNLPATDAQSDAPTPLAPESIASPMVSAPGEPIAPLEPSPTAPKKPTR